MKVIPLFLKRGHREPSLVWDLSVDSITKIASRKFTLSLPKGSQ